ncbi:MAG TPA: PAS domain S-box protein [Gammaproteobacteria bacterium]|nr:PAS domain S-box protein [Gammaproteobacteria bacterium]
MHRRIATRLSTVLVIIVATSAILMGIAVTQSGTHLLINASTARLAQESKVVSIRLQDIFEFVRRDIEFLVRSPAVYTVVNAMDSGAADATEAATAAPARARLQEVFAALLNNHPWYVQLRLIGAADEGRELVRVDQVDGQVRRVPEDALQPKTEREYFLQILDKPPGELSWSEIDLNREHGQIVEPAQPVLRAGLAVAGKDGTPFAIVIINLDIRRVFDAAREMVTPDLTLYIANHVGDYLYHPDPIKTFGFERDRRFQIQDDFTEAVFQLKAGTGVVLEDVSPAGAEEPPVVAYVSRLPLETTGGNDLMIALTMPRALILADVNQARRRNAALMIPFILIGALVVVWMVRVFIAPLERVTREVSRYAPGRPPQLPEQSRQDEVGQLAQAFASMAGRIEQQVTELEMQGKRFRSLFEAVPDAVLIIDQDGSVEYSNPATERLFGYTADELHGQNIKLLMPEPYRGHHDDYLRRYMAGGEAHIIGIGRKVVGLHQNGKTLPLYLSIGEFSLQGRRKFTGILHDISAHSRDRPE